MALLIPDEKCLVLQHEHLSLSSKNAAGYHPGPVAPSAADPALLTLSDGSWILPSTQMIRVQIPSGEPLCFLHRKEA